MADGQCSLATVGSASSSAAMLLLLAESPLWSIACLLDERCGSEYLPEGPAGVV
jgi:hypothetical protein